MEPVLGWRSPATPSVERTSLNSSSCESGEGAQISSFLSPSVIWYSDARRCRSYLSTKTRPPSRIRYSEASRANFGHWRNSRLGSVGGEVEDVVEFSKPSASAGPPPPPVGNSVTFLTGDGGVLVEETSRGVLVGSGVVEAGVGGGGGVVELRATVVVAKPVMLLEVVDVVAVVVALVDSGLFFGADVVALRMCAAESTYCLFLGL